MSPSYYRNEQHSQKYNENYGIVFLIIIRFKIFQHLHCKKDIKQNWGLTHTVLVV